MGDDDGGARIDDLVHPPQNLVFRMRIDAGQGVIENEDGCFPTTARAMAARSGSVLVSAKATPKCFFAAADVVAELPAVLGAFLEAVAGFCSQALNSGQASNNNAGIVTEKRMAGGG